MSKITIEEIENYDYVGLKIAGKKNYIRTHPTKGGFYAHEPEESMDTVNMCWTKPSIKEYIKQIASFCTEMKWFANKEQLNKWLKDE